MRGDSRAPAQLPLLVPLDWEEREEPCHPRSSCAAGLKQFPLSGLGSNLLDRKFPQSFHHRKFPGRKFVIRSPQPPTETCKLVEARWAEEVGVNRRRWVWIGQGAKGLRAGQHRGKWRRTMRYFASFGPGSVRKLHMPSFHLWASSFSPGRLTVERGGLTGAGSAADPSLHLSARFHCHIPRSIFKSKRDRSPHYIRVGKH